MPRSARAAVRRSPDSRLLAGAAGIAALATAAAVTLTPAGSASGLATGAAEAGIAGSQLAFAGALPDRDQAAAAERASRGTQRTALTAVQAPRAEGPVRAAAYGQVGLTAIAKPKPKPKPKPVVTPVEAPVAAAEETTTAAADEPTETAAAPQGGSTSAYAAAGAALGLAPSAVAVYSAIRSVFGITNIGGYRAGDGGDHGTGHAVDVMTSSLAQGDAVAAYAIANMGGLNIKYIIWKQRIWMGSGWQPMEDRGSITQNHFDHVHISVG